MAFASLQPQALVLNLDPLKQALSLALSPVPPTWLHSPPGSKFMPASSSPPFQLSYTEMFDPNLKIDTT